MSTTLPDAAAGTTPLPAEQRIATLDVLRGFALMGILIMNMPAFSYNVFAGADGSHIWPGRWDQLAEQVRDMLFSGKFNSMFSMLFGIGFTIQFTRLQSKDPDRAGIIYFRRLMVLAVLGVVHSCVFWFGDVLHIYAVLGLVLLFGLRRLPDRAVVALIVACLVFPAVNGILRVLLISKETVAERVAIGKSFEAGANAAYRDGGFLDALMQNVRVMAFDYGDPMSLWSTFGWYVAMGMTMLIGLLAGRRHWVQRIPELMPQIRRLTWWALAIGLVCGATFTVIFELNRVPGPSPIKVLGSVCYGLSRLSLMIFYVLVIVRLCQLSGWKRRLAPLAAAGRMPLTNYLMQTLICTTLFYNWGFGLYGKVGPALGFVLSLAIFWCVQVPWSIWWLKTHDRGPLEALWARLTYGRMTAAPASAAAVTAARP